MSFSFFYRKAPNFAPWHLITVAEIDRLPTNMAISRWSLSQGRLHLHTYIYISASVCSNYEYIAEVTEYSGVCIRNCKCKFHLYIYKCLIFNQNMRVYVCKIINSHLSFDIRSVCVCLSVFLCVCALSSRCVCVYEGKLFEEHPVKQASGSVSVAAVAGLYIDIYIIFFFILIS